MDLCRFAIGLGHRVSVIATDSVFCADLDRIGVDVVALDCIRREVRPLWDALGMMRLRRHLLEAGYDLVHTHTSKAGFVGRLAAHLAGIPRVVHTVHGFAFHERSPRPVIAAYAFLERLAAKWCDRIVTVSEFHRQWALDLGIAESDQIVAIPNGIDEPELPRGFNRDSVRQEIGASRYDVILLSVGRLAAGKGYSFLVSAMEMLKQEGVGHIKLAIAGDGPLRNRLVEEIDRRDLNDLVVLLGFRRDVASLYAASDIVVLPSYREGLSIALLEAMAMGKAIVASAIGSNCEVIGRCEAGVLVEPRRANALASALANLAKNTEMRARLGTNARQLFLQQYTRERMLSEYARLYTVLLDS